MGKIVLQNGNNMPLQAPLIPDPFVPYRCPRNRSLNAVCQGDPEVLKAYLANTPFTLADDRFLVYVSDFTNCDKIPFMDAGVVIPVEFEGRTGGYFLFEYEDNDAAIAAGRDLWGYPKKYGDILLEERGDRVTASVTRKGVPLITINCTLDGAPAPALKTTPHLNIHIQPAPDGGDGLRSETGGSECRRLSTIAPLSFSRLPGEPRQATPSEARYPAGAAPFGLVRTEYCLGLVSPFLDIDRLSRRA